MALNFQIKMEQEQTTNAEFVFFNVSLKHYAKITADIQILKELLYLCIKLGNLWVAKVMIINNV